MPFPFPPPPHTHPCPHQLVLLTTLTLPPPPSPVMPGCSDHPCTADHMASIKALTSGAMLCNDSHLNHSVEEGGKEVWSPNGAPTEVSLITVGVKAGHTMEALKAAQPRVASVPFESEHK
jgi:magnesium-transporting ATPase (P-type)